jgi:phenylalanyl-tRNA synthetase alpha chain
VNEKLQAIREAVLAALGRCRGVAEVENVRVQYLGRKGELTAITKELREASADQRPALGALINEVKEEVERAVAGALERTRAAERARRVAEERIDVTVPGNRPAPGRLNPITQVMNELVDVFVGFGFSVHEGPDVEDDYHNFEALNFPPDHPARDMQDTFFVEGGLVLRSHTSPVQIRTMLAGPPPVKIIAPGNVFRRDDDATHTPMFPQVEGLHVDRDVSFEDLKATLFLFVQRFFGPRTQIRLRPSFFPFTEPSAEVDASCFACGDAPQPGCRVCKGTGWLEIGGAGMVHPNVFKAVGYDKHDVTGFAFGMGLSRMAMLAYGIGDLRLFYDNDVRFLRQFPLG